MTGLYAAAQALRDGMLFGLAEASDWADNMEDPGDCATQRRALPPLGKEGEEMASKVHFFSEENPCWGCDRHKNVMGEPLRVFAKGLCSTCYGKQSRGMPLPSGCESAPDVSDPGDPAHVEHGVTCYDPADLGPCESPEKTPQTQEAAPLEHKGAAAASPCDGAASDNNATQQPGASDPAATVTGTDRAEPSGGAAEAQGPPSPAPPSYREAGDRVQERLLAEAGGEARVNEVFSLAMAKAEGGPSNATPFVSQGMVFDGRGNRLWPVRYPDTTRGDVPMPLIIEIPVTFTGETEEALVGLLRERAQKRGVTPATVLKALVAKVLLDELGERLLGGQGGEARDSREACDLREAKNGEAKTGEAA